MDMKELSYLIAIAEEKSISRAAERLYMAQSSLSQFLSSYEAALGSRLFIRTSSGVRPTDAGRLALHYAYEQRAALHLLQDEIQDLHELRGGRVLFGISSFRGSYLLPPVLNAFHMAYPGIHVQVVEQNSMALEQSLLNGELDLALIVIPENPGKLDIRYLLTDEICLIGSQNHPVFSKARKNRSAKGEQDIPEFVLIQDTQPYEFLLSGYDTILGREARRIFRNADMKPLSYNENLSALMAASMATSGIGLAFTYYSSRHYFRNGRFLSLGKHGSSIRLGLALSPSHYHSKASLALRDTIEKVMTMPDGFTAPKLSQR